MWLPDHEDRAALLRQHLQQAGVTRAELFTTDASRRAITFHDTRATGITWAAVRGDDPLRIKQRAGHKSFSTTEGYIREAENLREGFGVPFPPLPPDLAEVSARVSAFRRPPTRGTGNFPWYGVEQRGIEHPATGAPLVVDRHEDDAKQTTKGDERRREVSASGDVVEVALTRAIEAEVATRGAGWEARVALLAGELQAQRLAREGVARLEAKVRQRGAQARNCRYRGPGRPPIESTRPALFEGYPAPEPSGTESRGLAQTRWPMPARQARERRR